MRKAVRATFSDCTPGVSLWLIRELLNCERSSGPLPLARGGLGRVLLQVCLPGKGRVRVGFSLSA